MTALCLTRNRPQWLPQAIQCFQAQTYEHRELLIVADGADARHLVPDDSRIRYVHFSGQQTIGEKRNRGCELARGEIICHWDDDDWSASGRIEKQIAAMRETGAEVVGYRTMLFWDGAQAWRYDGRPLYALGTSLCYRRSWWSEHRFPAEQIGEDTDFVARARRVLWSCEAGPMMVARTHPGNTSPRATKNKEWRRVPQSALPPEFPR